MYEDITEEKKGREREKAHSSCMLSLVCKVSTLLTSCLGENLEANSKDARGTHEFGRESH